MKYLRYGGLHSTSLKHQNSMFKINHAQSSTLTYFFGHSTGSPTRYWTRHFFNNVTTNEDIATKFEADLPHCVRNMKEKNILLFKFHCNIFIGVIIIKEMPGSVVSGTPCTLLTENIPSQLWRPQMVRKHLYIHLHVKCLLFCAILNKIKNVWTNFTKNTKH